MKKPGVTLLILWEEYRSVHSAPYPGYIPTEFVS